MSRYGLDFISDDNLFYCVKVVIDTMDDAMKRSSDNTFRNSIDPFAAIFDISYRGTNVEQWLSRERVRQTQKTIENAIGAFHQSILGCMPDWSDLGVGNVVDLSNSNKKIIAEIKNKYNTTKGNHKKQIYDDIEYLIRDKYRGYTGYYVEIIPSPGNKVFDQPFTPSDNETHTRRPINENIRQIDGKSFYALASGDKEALEKTI